MVRLSVYRRYQLAAALRRIERYPLMTHGQLLLHVKRLRSCDTLPDHVFEELI